VVPGADYFIRNDAGNAVDSTHLTINSSWGTRCDSLDVGWQRDVVNNLYVGNSGFNVTGRLLKTDPQNKVALDQPSYWIIGFDLVPGDVTVNSSTGCATINRILGMIGPFDVHVRNGQGGAVVDVPIPADPGFAGLHTVFQWATIGAGNELIVSEVFGSIIFPDPFASSSSSSAVSLGGSAQGAMRAAVMKNLEKWMDDSPRLKWAPHKRQFLQAMKTAGY